MRLSPPLPGIDGAPEGAEDGSRRNWDRQGCHGPAPIRKKYVSLRWIYTEYSVHYTTYLPAYLHTSQYYLDNGKTMYDVGAAKCARLLRYWLINLATVLPCVDVSEMAETTWNFRAFALLEQ